MRYCAAAAGLIWVLGCSDTDKPAASELDELRISTHRGLDPLVPPTGASFSASLIDLVCPLVDPLDRRQLGPDTVELRRRAGSRPLAELATLVRHSGLISVRVDGDRLLLAVKPGTASDYICIEDGPYRIASQSPSELLLERRGQAGVRRIRVINVRDNEEEWRRFLAREVDIVPGVPGSQLRYVRELKTVKLIQFHNTPSIGLLFNFAKTSVEIRRAVSLAIHRKAVVRALGLDESNATVVPEDTNEAERLIASHRPPAPFRIVTYQGDANMRRAALVIEENLSRVGMAVQIEPLDIEPLIKRLEAGEFEAQLFYVSLTRPDWWSRFRTGDKDNVWRYSDSAYDAAVDGRDADTLLQILNRDVLATPVFRVPDVIAAERRLCDIKADLLDLTWLAGVRACAPGEKE
ncbi:MAG TPA: ABC transporter substrate-binding protein [Casimicrobiaceae bacterium]|nr:ABC transporter substrate-binding protein [Casimicrobiaceae bacterium]